MGNDNFDKVYYYCKPEVFESIIKKHEIWLCDMAKTNDYGEIHFVLDKIIKKVEHKTFLPELKQGRDKLLRYIKNVLSRFVKKYCWLAICFTTEGNKLLFWRTYGFNGKGFAIGFDKEKLESLAQNKNPKQVEGLRFHSVKYGKKQRDAYSNEMLFQLQDNLTKRMAEKELFKRDGKKVMHPNAHQDVEKWCEELSSDISYYKSSDFSFEKECRLCCVRKTKDILESIRKTRKELGADDKRKKKELHKLIPYGVSMNEQDAVIYTKLSISTDMITEIVIGPRNRATKKEIEIFLGLHGFNLDVEHIRKSEATYRS